MRRLGLLVVTAIYCHAETLTCRIGSSPLCGLPGMKDMQSAITSAAITTCIHASKDWIKSHPARIHVIVKGTILCA